jgi:AcrR family transcriptional regulator
MAQTLKEEVRNNIVEAAEVVFASDGYLGATMGAIAKKAGVSTGNIYRYFEDKDALFYTVLPDDFSRRFLSLVDRRVASLVSAGDLLSLDERAHRDADDLLGFWVENRLRVITLLDRSKGSSYEGFVDEFVARLVRPTLDSLREHSTARRVDPVARFVLDTLFRNTVRTIVAILEHSDDEKQIRTAFAGFWSYQLAGLAGFTRWVQS